MKRALIAACFLLLIAACALAESKLDGLYISEALTSNATYTAGNSYDFIELHNQSGKTLSLAGVTLSASKKRTYTFPSGTRLENGKYMLVYCTEDEGKAKSNVVYAGYSLPAQYAELSLTDADGNVLDHVLLGEQYGNISSGRAKLGADFLFLAEPTPGKANAKGYKTRVEEARIDTPAGFYKDSVRVTLSCAQDAEIRYTVNGDEPDTGSALYAAPLDFDQTTVLRARAFAKDGASLPSETVAATYFINDDPITPVVSLITDDKYLFDSRTGVMVKGSGKTPNYQQDWEYPVHVEYFTQDGAVELHQMATFRITGQVSRKYSQKGMTLTARKAFGSDRFVFSQSPFAYHPFTEFRSLFLRSAGTDGTITRFKDAMLSGLAEGTHALYQDSAIIQVYINGRYWGHYNLREKINQYFIAQHLDIQDEDDIENIQILEGLGRSGEGSEDYQALISFIKKNDLNKPENLEYVLARMDIDSYFDHAILEIICGNGDINNTRIFRVPGGKFTWILYDMDNAMKNIGNEPLFFYCKKPTDKATEGFEHAPFMRLMDVPEMREKFLARMGELLAEKFGDNLLARLDAWESAMTPVMRRQGERWTLLTFKEWQENVERLRYYATVRPRYTIEDITQLLKLNKDEVSRYFGAYKEPDAQ